MPFVEFPLRLAGGFLRNTGEPEAVLALIEIMGTTPHGSWRGSAHFGLRDLLTDPKSRQEFGSVAMQQINLALEDIGITEYRVQSVQREQATREGSETFTITLASTKEKDRLYATRLVRG